VLWCGPVLFGSGRVQWRALVGAVMNLRFRKRWGISWLVDRLLAFEDELCLVWLVGCLFGCLFNIALSLVFNICLVQVHDFNRRMKRLSLFIPLIARQPLSLIHKIIYFAFFLGSARTVNNREVWCYRISILRVLSYVISKNNSLLSLYFIYVCVNWEITVPSFCVYCLWILWKIHINVNMIYRYLGALSKSFSFYPFVLRTHYFRSVCFKIG